MSPTAVYDRIFDVLGVKKENSVNLDDLIRKGFSSTTLGRFKRTFTVSDVTLARSIGVSPKTLQRKKKSHQKLTVVESNKLYRVIKILAMAAETFGGDEKTAAEWIQEPQFGLGGKTPLDMLDTDEGTNEVESLLLHLQYGGVI